ncbi:MAG: hypothetical protein KF819_16400 [Labilithrix sp.]|nr:hypothetical protein [Labilithrix sp.]
MSEPLAASFPSALGWFVRQPWRGRELTIRWSTIGARARTTGYRWIAIRIGTSRLGVWANPPKAFQTDSVEGAPVDIQLVAAVVVLVVTVGVCVIVAAIGSSC